MLATYIDGKKVLGVGVVNEDRSVTYNLVEAKAEAEARVHDGAEAGDEDGKGQGVRRGSFLEMNRQGHGTLTGTP